ncbi:MAG: hypothetical protein ABIR71_01825 [Chthoniobacterales bacterium]
MPERFPSQTLRQILAVAFLWAILGASSARAVILLGTGDPNANTTPPEGDLEGSGWQFQGSYGGFLGTPIAPQHFISAQHINGAGTALVYNGVAYNLLEARNDPYSDLTVWRVQGTFPNFAPLYTGTGEVGQRLVVIGRGTQRGDLVVKNGTPRGWFWGPYDVVQRWGENIVTDIVNDGPVNQYVYAEFDANGSPNEAHLSSGDSGGAVFIRDGALWKLAGISYAVDGPFFETSTGGNSFDGALYDARDYYYFDPQAPTGYRLIAGPRPVPSGFYASRISSKLPFIYSAIDPAGDINGNGVSNMVEYGQSLNLPPPLGPGAPTVVKESGFVSIVFRKLMLPNAPQYAVQQSTDARSWVTVTPTEFLQSVQGEVHTIKARVPTTGSRLFLRVLISPPSS